MVDPIFSLKLKIGSLDVTEAPFITVGDTLTVEVLSNLDPANDLVSLKVIRQSDDAEIIIDGAGHHLRDRNISYLNSLHFDTSSLIPGGYEFYIETSNSGSQGLYLKSESISLVDNSPHQEGEENEDAGADYVEFLDDEPRSDLVIISSDGVVTLTIPGDMMVNDTQWSALESLKIVPIELSHEDEIAAYNVTPEGLSISTPVVLKVDYGEITSQVANKSNTVIKMYEKGEWVSVETAVNESSGILCVNVGHLNDFKIFAEVGPVPSPVTVPGPVVTTSPPATATPKEEPGFEAIFAVTCLLAVAFTLVRRDEK